MEWQDIEQQLRWMPLGRKGDLKAPAEGYKTNDPSNWMRRGEVTGELAGLNFGKQVGQDAPPFDLVGIDLDFKPELAPDEATLQDAKTRLNACLQGLPGLVEVSQSGKGRHIFGVPDAQLRGWVGKTARKTVPLAAGVTEYRGLPNKKACAAVEVFGGGNAQIAVTDRWGKGRGPQAGESLPEITLVALAGVLGDLMPKPMQKRVGGGPGARVGRVGVAGKVGDDGAWRPHGQVVDQDVCDELAEVAQALQLPGDYETWWRLGAAAHAGGMTESEFDAWSARSPNYTAGAVATLWRSLDKGPESGQTPIGVGTLLHWAKDCGWRPSYEVRRYQQLRVKIPGIPPPPPVATPLAPIPQRVARPPARAVAPEPPAVVAPPPEPPPVVTVAPEPYDGGGWCDRCEEWRDVYCECE